MIQTKQKNLFSGSLTKNILLFALPIMATGMLQLLFNAADLAVVGLFDSQMAVGAVGSTSALNNLIVNLLIGLSVGASVTVAQAFGAKDAGTVSRTVHTAFSIAITGGIVVGIIGFFLGGEILKLMDTNPLFLEDASLYMKIYFAGVPFTMIYNFGASILRAVGNTKTPLIYLALSGILNVLLNLFLVAVCHLGVAGVAIATAVSQTFAAILVVIYLMKSKEIFAFHPKQLRFHKRELLRIVRIGLPAGLQGSLFSISNVLIQSSVNSFGIAEVVTGNTAAMTIEGFVWMLMNAFSQAAMTFEGQTVGAERYDRIPMVARRCLLLVTAGGVLAGALCYLLRKPLLGIFLSAKEGENIALAVEYGELRLLLICLPYFACGVMDVLTGILRGMGSSTVPMIITVGGVCGLRIVWIYTVFAAFHTPEVLFLSYIVSWAATAIAQGILYFILRHRIFKRAGLLPRERIKT